MPASCEALTSCETLNGVPGPADACTNDWHLLGGASLYVIKPFFAGNTAYTTGTDANHLNASQQDTAFSWDYAASPAFWLEVVSPSGLGVRARYFHFDQTSTSLQTGMTPDQVNVVFIAPPPPLAIPSLGGFGAPGSLLTAGVGQDQLEFSSKQVIIAT